MLRNMSKTVGGAMAALCLMSTLAMAQAQKPPNPCPTREPAYAPRQPQNPHEAKHDSGLHQRRWEG